MNPQPDIEVRQIPAIGLDHIRAQAKVEGKQVIGVEFLPCNRCRVAIQAATGGQTQAGGGPLRLDACAKPTFQPTYPRGERLASARA